MPGYYNPYAMIYPASYNNGFYNGYQSNTMSSYPQQPKRKYIEWVQGEVGATAFQMPADLPPNEPIPLWDSTDTVIYMKSWGPMGIPNQMQKIRYNIPENLSGLPSGQNQNEPINQMSRAEAPESVYATKDDLNEMKREIQAMFSQQNQQAVHNQNGNKIKQDNRSENRL